MFVRSKNLVLLILLSLSAISCGRSENIEPLYETENIELQDAKIEMWNDIGMVEVEPSLVRQVTRAFFGWIPGVGGLIEFPLDLAGALIPPLPSVSHPALPKDAEWNDPRVLAVLKTIKLGAGYIRITPIEERGPDYKPETCFWPWEWGTSPFTCEDVEFDDFLSGVSVFLMFKDLRLKSELNEPKETEILLAYAETERDYDKNRKTMYFNVPDGLNLHDYMDKYERFEVKVIARGKYPRHKVFLDGKLRLDLEVKLSKR